MAFHLLHDFVYLFDNRLISRKPTNGIQAALSQPFRSFRFFEDNGTFSDLGKEGVHAEMEVWIVVFYGSKEGPDFYFYFEFFLDFPADGFFRRFAFFYFPSGEFPLSFEFSVSSFRGEDFDGMVEVISNDSGYDSDRFHRAPLLCQKLSCLANEFSRDRTFKVPDDIHRAAALVAHVFCFTEIDEGRSTGLVFVVFSDKEENLEAYFLMVDVALPRIGCFGCGALALPVEEMLIDGVVGVHGRRGIVFVGFVQCIDEKVEVSVFQVENALTHGFRFFWMAECDENLVLGVVAMEIERAGEAKIDVFIDEIEVIEVVLQDIADFLAHDRIFSDRGHVTCQVAVIVWIFRAVRRPDGVLEHLEHETSFFFCCIADGARHEFRKDGLDPSPGVDGTDFTHCFGNGLLERLFEVFPLVRLHAEAVEAGGIGPLRFSIGVEVLDVHAVVGKEIVQGKRSSAVFFKGADSLDELALCAKRCIDISKDVFG